MNRVFFIGAGPGAPDLLTVRGLNALSQCSVVYALPPYDEAFGPLLAGKTVFNPFDYYFAELLQQVEVQLRANSVAFLVPGDQTFLCPFHGIVDFFDDRADVIPGVGIVNAASATLKKSFDLPSVCQRTMLVSPRVLAERGELDQLPSLLDREVTVLLYLNHLPLVELAALLRQGFGENVPFGAFYRLGLEDQDVVLTSLDDVLCQVDEVSQFSLKSETDGRSSSLLFYAAGHALTAKDDGEHWDRRRARTIKAKGD